MRRALRRPIRGLAGSLLVTVGVLVVGGEVAWAQTPLEQVVERARAAWLAHEADELVAGSDTVRLRIPGVAFSEGVQAHQAARLLARYLGKADEFSFDLQGVRHVGEGHAYAELERRYVVRGTSDHRVETVFFGFRVIGAEWRLREVRVTP